MRNVVKLQRPTDFLVLEVLDEKGRNVAPNIALEIDKSRSHVNVRLPILEDYGLVKKIGPSEQSGLYEITPEGRVALRNRDRYDEEGTDFGEVIRAELDASELNADEE